MSLPFKKLAIIAGEGDIPLEVAQQAARQGVEVHILAVKGHADPALYQDQFPTHTIRMGALKANLAIMNAAGIRDLIMVGAVRRPSLLELAPDRMALKVLSRGALKRGDDGLLRAIIDYLEQSQGIQVHGLGSVLNDVSPEEGVLGLVSPDAQALEDIARGRAVLMALADQDVGQAVVVQETLVLGVEGVEGTDDLVRRCSSLKREGAGPILVKLKKPSQTTRADLPTVGPDTIRAAAKEGYSGIALEAGGSILVQRDICIQEADAAGLFLIAVKG